MELQNIQDYLSALKGRNIVYVCNDGNAGDSFINFITLQVLDELGLTYEIWRPEHFTRGNLVCDVILLGGGGNFNHLYQEVARLIRDIQKNCRYNQLILLPHTITGNQELITGFDERVTLFCRERTSFDYVRSLGGACQVYLSQDMAFYYQPQHVPPKNLNPGLFSAIGQLLFNRSRNLASRSPLWRLYQAAAYVKHWLKGMPSLPSGNTLSVYRVDEETTGQNSILAENVDLSHQFHYGMKNIPVMQLALYRFLAAIVGYDTIVTDRLHVAIGAALLGKNVRLYDNSYFKNRAIYEYSLRDAFPNVTYCGPDAAEPTGLSSTAS